MTATPGSTGNHVAKLLPMCCSGGGSLTGCTAFPSCIAHVIAISVLAPFPTYYSEDVAVFGLDAHYVQGRGTRKGRPNFGMARLKRTHPGTTLISAQWVNATALSHSVNAGSRPLD